MMVTYLKSFNKNPANRKTEHPCGPDMAEHGGLHCPGLFAVATHCSHGHCLWLRDPVRASSFGLVAGVFLGFFWAAASLYQASFRSLVLMLSSFCRAETATWERWLFYLCLRPTSISRC